MSAKLEQKKIALAKASKHKVEEVKHLYENTFEVNGDEYIVLSDEERKEAVIENIKESASYFSSSFLAGETELPEIVFESLVDKNEAVVKIIEKLADGGISGFAKRAVEADGFGHFLNGYNGEEKELPNGFYAYQVG